MDSLTDSLVDSGRGEKYMDFYDKLGRNVATYGLVFFFGLILQVLSSKIIA